MLKLILATVLSALLASAVAAEEPPEYYCHDKKQDRYLFADPGDKKDCEAMGGKFGTFSRKERKYFCRLSDSGFYLGKSYKRKAAEEICTDASGKLQ